MNKHIAAIIGSTLVWGMSTTQAAESPDAVNKAAAKVAVEVCSSCHGPGGNSISPTFPRLAAQREEYIVNQLKAFKSRKRAEQDAHDFMWGMAAPLDDKLIGGLAHYYASQIPSPMKPGDPVLIAKGRDMFEKGVASKPLPPCVTCHGKNGEGIGEFPRLAGQHAAYIVKQITLIQSLLRAAPVMHGIVSDMNGADMKAVAEFLQSK
jgi:cytochrome c553